MSKENGNSAHRLTLYIVIAIVAAIALAIVQPLPASKLKLGGEIFLRLLQMVVVPLVMASVMSGILGLGDVRKLGRPGGFAVLYYLTTTILAVATGLIVVNIVNPGTDINPALVEDARQEGAEAVEAAKEALRSESRKFTWSRDFDDDQLILEQKSASGSSNALTIPADSNLMVAISVQQVGTASQPASVEVLWRADRESDFQPLTWSTDAGEQDRFVAGKEPDLYSKSVAIPNHAYQIKLDYQEQTGGASSTVVAEVVHGPPQLGDIFTNLVLMLFTNNLLESMVEINLLPLILFSIVFAGMLTTMGKRSEVIANLVIGINDALMSFILLLMKLAPLGIFCLVASRFGRAQLEGQFIALVQVQFYYMVTVLSG